MQSGNVEEKYKAVCGGIDEITKKHGYVRNGNIYKVERESRETVALFCHFGVEWRNSFASARNFACGTVA